MKPKINLLVGATLFVWSLSAVLATGIINADNRHGRSSNLYQSPYYAKKAYFETAVISSIFGPLALIAAWSSSGGAYFGLSYDSDALPCTSKRPDVWCQP